MAPRNEREYTFEEASTKSDYLDSDKLKDVSWGEEPSVDIAAGLNNAAASVGRTASSLKLESVGGTASSFFSSIWNGTANVANAAASTAYGVANSAAETVGLKDPAHGGHFVDTSELTEAAPHEDGVIHGITSGASTVASSVWNGTSAVASAASGAVSSAAQTTGLARPVSAIASGAGSVASTVAHGATNVASGAAETVGLRSKPEIAAASGSLAEPVEETLLDAEVPMQSIATEERFLQQPQGSGARARTLTSSEGVRQRRPRQSNAYALKRTRTQELQDYYNPNDVNRTCNKIATRCCGFHF